MRMAHLIGMGFAVSVLAGLSGFADETDAGLRRVACTDLMVFAPANGVSESDLCRAHGGVALAGSTEADAALVILVRNRPAGGDQGLASFPKGS